MGEAWPGNRVTMRGADMGRETDLVFQHVGADKGRMVRSVPLAPMPPAQRHELCPICLSAPADTEEHVPPQSMGGRAVIYTCNPCNNILGTRIDNPWMHWLRDSASRASISGAGVRGHRKLSTMAIRETSGSKSFGVFMDISPRDREDFQTMMSGAKVELRWAVPGRTWWRLAAMKSAYLAACLFLGYVPLYSPMAAAIRGDLLAVRDGQKGVAPPLSKIHSTLRVSRTNLPPNGRAVSLDALQYDDGEIADWGIHLGGVVFVSWPLEPALLQECKVWLPPNRAAWFGPGGPPAHLAHMV